MLSLLLDIDDVAKLIKLSPATVENWAYGRKPAPAGFPAPIKVGRLRARIIQDMQDRIEASADIVANGEKLLSSVRSGGRAHDTHE
jgi:hypothetical protein